MKIHFRRSVAGALCLAATLAGSVRAGETSALRGATVVYPDGTRIENAVIVMEEGVIKAIAEDASIPYDATVIDAGGRVVVAGLVEIDTSYGLDRANESLGVVPFVDVYDAVDPNNAVFQDALRSGITTLHISQGNNCTIAGMSRIVRPLGMMVEDMTVRPDSGIKVSISPRSGQNPITHMAELRKAFSDLHTHVETVAERLYEEDQKKKGEQVLVPPDEAVQEGMKLLEVADLDSKWRTLYRFKGGQLPFFLHCNRSADVLRGIAWVGEMGLMDQCTFVLGTETFKVADAIKATGRPVILSSTLTWRERDPITDEETETFVPKVFADAGVKFALKSQGLGGAMGEGLLWYQAARLVREGLPPETALNSITQWPADMIGMGDLLGAIQPGRYGNFAVLSGEPLDQATVVEMVMVEGRLVYERSKDARLKKLLTGEDQPRGDG